MNAPQSDVPLQDATSFAPLPQTPRVLVCVVAHNGERRLTATLRSIRAQGYPSVAVVAIDCGSTDDSYAILASRLGERRVLKAFDNPGFGPAIHRLLNDPMVSESGLDACELLLFIHDDMVLSPGAIQWLVHAAQQDPMIGVVGPKVRAWSEDPILQSIGMSADVLGHLETGIDWHEMDQGQHDIREAALWVPSAGMLIRADAWRDAGGFDERFGMLREDFDLCWRLRIKGWRVGLQCEAIAYHESRSTLGNDPNATLTSPQYRFFAARNETLAVLTNTPWSRLWWIIPLQLFVGLLTTCWLLLGRRWGEALAMVRAFGSVLLALPGTLALHGEIQASRRVSEGVIGKLRASGIPRITRGIDRIISVLTPSESPYAQPGEASDEDDTDEDWALGEDLAEQPIRRLVRDASLIFVALPLLIMVLFGLVNTGMFSPGDLVGGHITTWPTGQDFLRGLLDPTNAEPLTSNQFPSPIQAVLGVLTLIIPGPPWVAARIIVFGLLPLAWYFALRLGTHITTNKTAKVLGATVYVTMPIMLASVGQGQFGIAILAALYPYIVHLTINIMRPRDPKLSWRSAALLVVFVVIVSSASLVSSFILLLPVLAISVISALVVRRYGALLRILFVSSFAGMIVAPWVWDWYKAGAVGSFAVGQDVALSTIQPISPVRAMFGDPLLVYQSMDVLAVGSLLVTLGIILGALLVGLPKRPLFTGLLIVMMSISALATWAIGSMGMPGVWPPMLLIPHALALALMAMIVVANASTWRVYSPMRGTHAYAGQRLQVHNTWHGMVSLLASLVMGVGLIFSGLMVGSGDWQHLQVKPSLLPAFIGADMTIMGDQRVLLLRRHVDVRGTSLQWELQEANGSTMVRFGSIGDLDTIAAIDNAVSAMTSEIHADAGSTLGMFNIRYVVVQDSDPNITSALSAQSWLEPIPTETATVFAVKTWLPRVSVLTQAAATPFLQLGTLPESTALATGERIHVTDKTMPNSLSVSQQQGQNWIIVAHEGHGGVLILADGLDAAWHATIKQNLADPALNGTELARATDVGPFNQEKASNIWRIPPGETTIVLTHLGSQRHEFVLFVQLLLLLIALSFAVRPPGVREEDHGSDVLPQDVRSITDMTGEIPVINVEHGISVQEDAHGFAARFTDETETR